MKIKSIATGTVVCVILAMAVGCKKQEPSVEQPKAPEAVSSEAGKGIDTAKTTATQATEQASAQLGAAQQEAQGIIDQAKKYVAENKYQDALSSLSKLGSIKLTPEQQQMVDSLKAQIQKALAKATTSDAASALGGALGDKK